MISLTEAQLGRLAQLYNDGAWTSRELAAQFSAPQTRVLQNANILLTYNTAMGKMTVLGAVGVKLVDPDARYIYSPTRQLDRAYLRLCVSELGWRATELARFQDYSKAAPSTTLQLLTPYGPALVAGKLSSGGHSLRRMKTLLRLLTAPALRHNFKVVFVMPSSRRGQALQVDNRVVLRIVRHLPNADAGAPAASGIQRVEGHLRSEAPPGPSITPGTVRVMRERAGSQTVPNLTLQILQMNRADRVEQARADLEVDRVISGAQLRSYYDLDASDLPGTVYVNPLVHPAHGQPSLEVAGRFLCVGRGVARLEVSRLAHLAGTGELRRQLGIAADPNTYQVEPRGRRVSEVPDAWWWSPEGPVALEYDAGFYPPRVVFFKVKGFREGGAVRVAWGVTSALRGRRFRVRYGVEDYLCDWWTDRWQAPGGHAVASPNGRRLTS